MESKRVDGGLLTGLRVDEEDRAAPVSDSGDEFGAETGSGEVGSRSNWPPWKNINIPQRYKIIGTTSLAFVICNMDKVAAFASTCCHFSVAITKTAALLSYEF